MTLTHDPVDSGTERLVTIPCVICGSPHMSRTRLCSKCQDDCMELGKAVMTLGDGTYVVVKASHMVLKYKPDWYDHLEKILTGIGAAVITVGLLYFGAHIIVAMLG